MSEPIVSPWHKFGRHRLYVNRPDSTSIGYWDLVTDEAHPNDATDLEALVQWVNHWKAENPDKAGRWAASGRSTSDKRAHPDAPSTHEAWRVAYEDKSNNSNDESIASHDGSDDEYTMWTDLAGNPAGAEARKRAYELRGDSRVRAAWDRLRGGNKEERNWRIGADGEEKVGAVLAKVARKDPSWREPINAVPVGNRGSDIDHVFIGSGGVFTINVKHHPRGEIWAGGHKMLVNGQNWNYVRNSLHEAERASKLLSTACGFAVHVEALIVIIGAKKVRIGVPADGAHVLEGRYLMKWLLARRRMHSDGIVQSVYDAARRSTVWRPPKSGR